MRPLPSVLVMLALVLVAVGAALLIAGPPPSSVAPASEPRVAEPGEPRLTEPAARPEAPAAAAAGRARRGRALPLAEAIKELDLIKPARTKLADDFAVPTPGGETFRLGD